MTWQRGPMRAVERVDFSEGVARFKWGRIDGSQTKWTLTLVCGHLAVRYTPLGAKQPKKARCDYCEGA